MRRFLAALVALSALSCFADADLYIDLTYFKANPATNRWTTLQWMNPVPGNLYNYTSTAAGGFWVSNATVGDIVGTVKQKGTAGEIRFQVTIGDDDTGTLYASNITSVLGIQTYPSTARSSYSIAAANNRFARIGSGGLAFTPQLGSANLTNWSTLDTNVLGSLVGSSPNALTNGDTRAIGLASTLSVTSTVVANGNAVVGGVIYGNAAGVTNLPPKGFAATNTGTAGQVFKKIDANTGYWADDDSSGSSSGSATNVYYGGSVTTSNVLTKIASDERTNANLALAYGGIQASTAVYGQSATGNYNYRNGLEFLGAGWNGTPIDYSDLANHPSGFIHMLTNWGGSTGFNSLVLHIATPGAIRLEPNYGEPTFGVGYLTLGNEDGNAKVFINDVNQSTTNGADGNGYSQPLYFSTKGINGGTERTATPAIMGRWAGTNSGAGAYEGWYAAELSFMSRGPTADTDWPTFGRLFPTQTIEVGRMRTNGWQFFGPVNLVQSTVTLQATNVVLDFNSASASDIALASGVTNRFSTVNVNAYGGTTNLEQRWFRIRSGGLDTPLQWPTWSAGSESGAASLPAVLPATNILFLRLSSWGSGDTNVVADWRMSPDTTFAYDSDAVTFFTAASITDATQKGAVDYLVKSLKAGNLWTNMIAVYPFVGGASNKHALNLKAPSTYPITFTSSGVTHNGSGITGDGSTGYGVIPLDWTSAIGGSAISNFHVAVYNKTTAPTDGGAFIGGRNGSSVGVGLTRESASVGVRGAMNTLGPNAIVNLSTDLRGALIETRANSTAAFEIATRLGVTSTSSASTAVPTTNPYLLAYNFNGSASGFTTANLTYASLGYGFTPAELTNLVYILDNYDRARSATTIPYNYVYTGSGSGLSGVPATAMAGGSQGQVVTWHGSGAIWSNPPAGGGSFTLTMNPNQFAQAGGTTNIKSGATLTNINQWGNFVLRSEDAANDITVTNHSQKLKINSTANPYAADTEVGEDIKARTFYGTSNNITGGIRTAVLSITGAETNSSLTGGVIAADSNGKRKVASLSNLTWDGTTLSATASGGGETYSYTNLSVLNFGSTAAGITTNNGQLYAFGYSDGIFLTNCWMTAGTNEVRCTNANFVAGDVGKSMLVTQMGDASSSQKGYDVSGIITNVLSSTRVLLGPASANYATNTTGFAGMANDNGSRYQMTNMPARYGHDDSTNLQTAINWAVSNRVSKIKLRGVTIIAGPFQQTNSYNALICMPFTKWPDQTVHPLTIEGETAPMVGGGASPMNGGTTYGTFTGGSGDGTWIMCNNPGSGNLASATGFPESMFCGGTNVNSSWPGNAVLGFNNLGVVFRNLGIRTASNPLMGALNFVGAGNFSLEWVNIDSTFTSYGGPKPDYSYAKAFALATPGGGNNGPGGNTLRNVCISSFYNSIYADEHLNGDEVFIETSFSALNFPNGSVHISHFGHLMLQGCAVGITAAGGSPCYLNISSLDVEHNGYPTWLNGIVTPRDVYDTQSKIFGTIQYQVTAGLQANSIGYATNLIVYGATNAILREMGRPWPARAVGQSANTNLVGGVLMANFSSDVVPGYNGGVGTNLPTYGQWKAGLEVPQLSVFPTNYIPSSSSGVTNFVLLNLTNTINGGGLQFVATNTAASGSFLLRKITQTETAWP